MGCGASSQAEVEAPVEDVKTPVENKDGKHSVKQAHASGARDNDSGQCPWGSQKQNPPRFGFFLFFFFVGREQPPIGPATTVAVTTPS